ncbi:hypothetical protein DIPPA_08981 [Diplonema papillatum]|nr:hypothetical protein DIPPA_08981 [Diplonema papillatum]
MTHYGGGYVADTPVGGWSRYGGPSAAAGQWPAARQSKRVTVSYREHKEVIKLAGTEGTILLKDTIAAALGLSQPFTLKDESGATVPLSLSSLEDRGSYAAHLVQSDDGSSFITTARRVLPNILKGALSAAEAAESPPRVDSAPRFLAVPPALDRRRNKKRKGSVRAVLVGVEYRRRPDVRLRRESVVDRGVKRMRKYLEETFEDPVIMEVLEEEEEEGIVIQKGGTRRDDILRWAKWLAEHPAKCNIFYFIGHAAVLRCGADSEEVLLPSDFSTQAVDESRDAVFNAIRGSELIEAFGKASPSSHIHVISDCTYGGTVLSLPCRLRLHNSGDVEMIETRTDQDSPLLAPAHRVTVLARLASTTNPSQSFASEGMLTTALVDILSADPSPHDFTNESLLVSLQYQLRRLHGTTLVQPVMTSTHVLEFTQPFTL